MSKIIESILRSFYAVLQVVPPNVILKAIDSGMDHLEFWAITPDDDGKISFMKNFVAMSCNFIRKQIKMTEESGSPYEDLPKKPK